MNTARRSYLKDVMDLAWGLFRCAPERGFADALRGAWRWTKASAARMAATPVWITAPRSAPVALRSMLQSPIRRSLSGPYAGERARSAGYVTSMLGR